MGRVCLVWVLVLCILAALLIQSQGTPSHVRTVNRLMLRPNRAPPSRLAELIRLMRRHDALDDVAFYEYWDYTRPENTEWIVFMSELTRADGPCLARKIRPLLRDPAIDIGGNRGVFARLLGANVTVWDQPHVVDASQGSPTVGGDFLVDPMPPDSFETAIFKSVLHDLSDEHARALLRKVADSGVGRIIIVETMRPLDARGMRAPYFRHLRRFAHLFRTPRAYLCMARECGYSRLVSRMRLRGLMYTILVLNRPT